MENNLVNNVGNAVEAFIYSKIKDSCTSEMIRDVCNDQIDSSVSNYFNYEFCFSDHFSFEDHFDISVVEDAVDNYCSSNVRGYIEDYANDNLDHAVQRYLDETLSDTVRDEIKNFFTSDAGRKCLLDAIVMGLQR
jgi:hypothetical protein